MEDSGIDLLSAIKIDSEGSELAIFKGAVNTILTHKPLILFEYCDLNMVQFGNKKEELISFLKNLGYENFDIMAGDAIAF